MRGSPAHNRGQAQETKVKTESRNAAAAAAYLPREPRRCLARPHGEGGPCRAERPLDQGKVRVVRDPKNAKIEQGEILVAEFTDPGWIMLFPAASGILVERGSLLSHSAIVSRELGIPAVVGITGLIDSLNDGDVVEFDGTTGDVTKLSIKM